MYNLVPNGDRLSSIDMFYMQKLHKKGKNFRMSPAKILPNLQMFPTNLPLPPPNWDRKHGYNLSQGLEET
jgi:hypothetical protein